MARNSVYPSGMKKDADGNHYWPDDDMRTLMRAAAIRKDPKRLADARACARKKLEEQVAETAQMRALANGAKK